jgi:hypothetical protein
MAAAGTALAQLREQLESCVQRLVTGQIEDLRCDLLKINIEILFYINSCTNTMLVFIVYYLFAGEQTNSKFRDKPSQSSDVHVYMTLYIV